MEDWKTIDEFPRYSVSSEGRIRNEHTGRILRLEMTQYNVVMVGLMSEADGRQHKRSVPLLVASAFVPNTYGDRFDTPICLNGDRADVRASNLDWRPRWFAIKYNQQYRKPDRLRIRRPIRDVDTGVVYPNTTDCCKRLGLLENELVLGIMNREYVWPLHHKFEFA